MRTETEVSFEFATHPFFQPDRMLIVTDPLRRTFNEISLAVIVGAGGTWLEELSGGGKTAACRFMVDELRRKMRDTLIIHFPALRVSEKNLQSLPHRLAISVGESRPHSRIHALRQQLESRLIAAALGSPYRKVVLVIDEAQALREMDFALLKDLHNAMASRGCSLATVLMGESPKFGKKIQKFKSDEEERGVMNRFALHRARLNLYASLEDIHSICVALDTTVQSDLDGMTVTQSLLPRAYASGMRLANHAGALWSALGCKPTRAREAFKTLRYGLMLCVSKDDADFVPDEALFATAGGYAQVHS